MRKAVRTALENASKGLLYPSDSDEPFESFTWGKAEGDLTPAKVRPLAGAGPKAAVQEVALDDFFKELTSDEIKDAGKYKDLWKVVKEQLADARVFRVGEVNIDVYIVGKTAGGEWAGLKTVSVET